MVLISCLVPEPHVSLWAALMPGVKFSWFLGVQLGELLLNRSPSDYERNRLLRNSASCSGWQESFC